MAVSWDRAELEAAEQRGRSDRWSVEVCSLTEGWLVVQSDQIRRVYAHTEHPELPSQFAAVQNPSDFLHFAQTYGRLGYVELSAQGPVDEMPPNPNRGLYDEPVDWALAHARTVRWCLGAAALLRQPDAADVELQHAWTTFPQAYGIDNRLATRPSETEHRGLNMLWTTSSRMSVRERVARLLGDTIHVNIKHARRRIFWRGGRLLSYWGGVSLIDGIYSHLADSVTGGTLARCEAAGCGAVFIQTDKRQRYCPPRDGQSKSPCATRMRMRRKRAIDAEKKRRSQGIAQVKTRRPPARRAGVRELA